MAATKSLHLYLETIETSKNKSQDSDGGVNAAITHLQELNLPKGRMDNCRKQYSTTTIIVEKLEASKYSLRNPEPYYTTVYNILYTRR